MMKVSWNDVKLGNINTITPRKWKNAQPPKIEENMYSINEFAQLPQIIRKFLRFSYRNNKLVFLVSTDSLICYFCCIYTWLQYIKTSKYT